MQPCSCSPSFSNRSRRMQSNQHKQAKRIQNFVRNNLRNWSNMESGLLACRPNHLPDHGGLCQLLHQGQHRPGQRRGASTASRTYPTRTSVKTNLRPVRRRSPGQELRGFSYQRMNRASEHFLVVLLDKWSTCWKHRGRTRAIGPHAYEKYCTLGFFGHGGVFGISKASEMKRACIAFNQLSKSAFHQTWTSIALCLRIEMS